MKILMKKKASSANLLSNDTLRQNVLRNKNDYYIVIKVIVCQEDKIVLNLGPLNNITSRYIIFKLLKSKIRLVDF